MSLSFDGANDVVTLEDGNDAAAELALGSELTIAAWIKPVDAGENNHGMIFSHGVGTVPRVSFGLNNTSGRLRVVMDGSTGDGDYISANNGWTADVWQHVAVVLSMDDSFAGSGNDEPLFYKNGAALGALTTDTDPTGTEEIDDADGYVGNDSTGARTFNGLIGELCVWTRRLSAIEVASVYRHGPMAMAGTEMLLYLPMDHLYDTDRVDVQGRARHIAGEGNATHGVVSGATLAENPPTRPAGRAG